MPLAVSLSTVIEVFRLSLRKFTLLCFLAFISLTGRAARAQQSAATPSGNSALTGSSDSGELEKRLLFRARRALRENGDAANADKLGAPNGYHWIILMQVARYSDSNVRLTNMRRGAQRFLEALVQSRQGLAPAAVTDTVSVLPYHFSLLGEPRGRVQPLRNYLSNVSNLKKSVPGSPQDDRYQGQNWRDGHDWRAAMQQTLQWMKSSDIEPRQTVIIVLDWNDLAQAPLTLADGTKPAKPATDSDLVLPSNPKRFQSFATAMQDAGFDPKKNLETVQVGNLEYDLAVFTPQKLEPIAGAPTPATAPVAAVAPAKKPESSGGSGGLIALPILLLLGGGAFFLMKPVNFRLDETETRSVSALPAKTLPILGAKTEANGAHFRVPTANIDTDRPLAVFSTDFSKKLSVADGACKARGLEGFDQTPTGLKLRGQAGELELVEPVSGRVLTTISVRKL